MSTFRNKLKSLQDQKKSLLCVGIDPDFDKIPPYLQEDPDWLFKFCKTIIEETAEFAIAFKLNFAFFEIYGAKGWEALERLRKIVPDNCLTIADAKRGDISPQR